ncbi:hypothetical protein C8Q76DRAFT_791528 [Earliella scabrosa]|nr:hypothetical protein C8Q76DRAFT_791528 [Earliella scabrosa]
MSLPKELMQAIFAELSILDVVRCATVCRYLHDIIKNDILLQYSTETRVNGMVDGPPDSMTVSERLDRLLQHGKDMQAMQLSCHTYLRDDSHSVLHSSSCLSQDGSLVHFSRNEKGTSVVIDALPSTTRGLQAHRYVPQLPMAATTDVLAVDVSQELAVVIELGNDRGVVIKFLCTKGANIPHPLARRPVLNLTDSSDAYYHIQSVQVVDERLFWVVPDFSAGTFTLECWDWRAGRMLWQRTFDASPSYEVLDDDHVLIHTDDKVQNTLGVYVITSHGQQHTCLPLCTYQLPRVKAGQSRMVDMQLTRPARGQAASGPFTRDPASAALVLRLGMEHHDGEGASNELLLIAPLETLLEPARATVPPTADASAAQAERVVEWEAWGPGRTLLLNLPHDPSASSTWFVPRTVTAAPYGSRVSLLVCDDPEMRSGFVVTFDVDSWAARRSRRHRGEGSSDGILPAGMVDALGILPGDMDFRSTGLRYAVSCAPRIVFPPGQRPTRVMTTHDGFAAVVSNSVLPPSWVCGLTKGPVQYDRGSSIDLQVFTV